MNNSNQKQGSIFLILVVVGLVLTRVIPHFPNFTAFLPATLFGAAHLSKKWLAVLVPILTFWVSDFVINNTIYAQYYDGIEWFAFYQIFTFGSIGLIAMVGFFMLKKVNLKNVVLSSVLAVAIFFIVSNFGTWVSPVSIYPKTFSGLIACYIAAIPFLTNTLVSTLVISGALFGGYNWLVKNYPQFSNKNLLEEEVLLSNIVD